MANFSHKLMSPVAKVHSVSTTILLPQSTDGAKRQKISMTALPSRRRVRNGNRSLTCKEQGSSRSVCPDNWRHSDSAHFLNSDNFNSLAPSRERKHLGPIPVIPLSGVMLDSSKLKILLSSTPSSVMTSVVWRNELLGLRY